MDRTSRTKADERPRHKPNPMNSLEAAGWQGFLGVVPNFLGNKRADNFRILVKSMVDAYQRLGANMSIKVNQFLCNCGDFSDEQGERFRQHIKELETRYQSRWDAQMMADY